MISYGNLKRNSELVVIRGGAWEVGERVDGAQRVQRFTYKMSKFQNIQSCYITTFRSITDYIEGGGPIRL